MKIIKLFISIFALAGTCIFVGNCVMNTSASPDYKKLIANGEYTAAAGVICDLLVNDNTLSTRDKLGLAFELDRIERIRIDFTKTEVEIREYVREYIPDASDEDFMRWETSQALEWKLIDGEKRYFNRAGRNLFRIDAEARKIWAELHKADTPTPGSGVDVNIDQHNARIIGAVKSGRGPFVKPVRLRIKQALEVDADAVPAGETIRCWIPFPRVIPGRQEGVRLLNTSPDQSIMAPADALQRTIYFEKIADPGETTRFEVEYEYTAYGTWIDIDPGQVVAVTDENLQEHLSERPPHIVFTPELQAISAKVVGDETNPYLIARKLFKWVDDNIPWASAREYSTIRNIPAYAIANKHGDCGIQALTFITLCRMNGIPARWQSGWEFKPPNDSMHDWGIIYFEPYGWSPMDPTYGIRDVDNKDGKWFYVSGMDSYRTIYNDDYSQPFYPAKVHPRSETVDSQRGEVEWRGGNLYFNQWSWFHDWEIIEN